MIVRNITKKNIIAKDAKSCGSILSMALGLMFTKDKKRTLIFKFRKEKIIALHMFFVFYPIDVIFLNKKKMVVDVKKNFRPFTFYNSKKAAFYAIEFPNGVVRKSKAEIGDMVSF